MRTSEDCTISWQRQPIFIDHTMVSVFDLSNYPLLFFFREKNGNLNINQYLPHFANRTPLWGSRNFPMTI